jgi:hypothetical protein
VVGCCECGNEPSGCMKCGEFLDWPRTCQLLKKDYTGWSWGCTRIQTPSAFVVYCVTSVCYVYFRFVTDVCCLMHTAIYFVFPMTHFNAVPLLAGRPGSFVLGISVRVLD